MESFIPTILENFLGEHRRHSEHKEQISFDCPACDDGSHKGNLEINYGKGVYKCWACKETNNMYGSLQNLIVKYGSKDDLKSYKLLKPTHDRDSVKIDTRVLEIPEGMTPLLDSDNFKATQMIEYLHNRNVGDDIIRKFNMSFVLQGKYRNRVIIPSYSSDNHLEYYVTRAFTNWVKPKYLNADLDKDLIIFFEQHINWDATIYIVEGVFDAIVIPNAIPILGKYISDKLFHKLQEKAKANIVIILDGDAVSDAKKLYVKLNTLNLYNRVKIVELSSVWDLSLINQKMGKKGLYKVLKSAHQLKESLL